MEPAAVPFCNLMRDEQAKAEAVGLGRDERMEQLIAHRRRRALAGVADANRAAIGGGPNDIDQNSRRNGLIGHRGVNRVENQVGHQLAKRLGITLDSNRLARRRELQVDSGVKARRTHQAQDFFDQLRGINSLANGGNDIAERKELPQIRLHQTELPQGHVERFVGRALRAIAAMQLNGHAAAGGGIAKLVGH